MPSDRPAPKPCLFIGASRRELKALPDEVQDEIGHALYEVQCSGEPVSAKALKGFGGRAGGAVSDLPDRKGSAEP